MQNNYSYQVISMAVILRDIEDGLHYIDEKHKKLVDIADALYNADISPEQLKPEYKELYNEQGEDFWEKVIKDASAIDSQVEGHENDLLLEYNDYIRE